MLSDGQALRNVGDTGHGAYGQWGNIKVDVGKGLAVGQ